MKAGDRVRIKDSIRGDQRAFYARQASPGKVYVVEFISIVRDVYLVGETNYFRESSLEIVE